MACGTPALFPQSTGESRRQLPRLRRRTGCCASRDTWEQCSISIYGWWCWAPFCLSSPPLASAPMMSVRHQRRLNACMLERLRREKELMVAPHLCTVLLIAYIAANAFATSVGARSCVLCSARHQAQWPAPNTRRKSHQVDLTPSSAGCGCLRVRRGLRPRQPRHADHTVSPPIGCS